MNAVTALLRSLFVRVALIATLFGVSAAASSAVFVSVDIAPPALPVYVQPVIPAPGYIWTPGYWAWGPDGYYWVPGTWVLAPYVGALWTPGYWGWGGAAYLWHGGYWGPRVGFYGGINYGFGYTGVGYWGGYWNNGAFFYNRTVSNVNITNIHNTYERNVVVNNNVSRVSFNGGSGGIAAQPTAEERLAERDRHQAWTPMQSKHEQAARSDRAQLASVNHGTPAVTALSRPATFKQKSAMTGGATTQGSNAFQGGGQHPHKDARIDRGGQPGGQPGSGHPQEMAHVQNGPHPQHTGPQGQPHPQGERGEHHEEHQR